MDNQLEFIHRLKTAALFRTSLAIGGILAGGASMTWISFDPLVNVSV